MVGDVLVNSEAPMVTLSISRICQLSLSEVLIRVGLYACICERLRLYCVSKKKREEMVPVVKVYHGSFELNQR